MIQNNNNNNPVGMPPFDRLTFHRSLIALHVATSSSSTKRGSGGRGTAGIPETERRDTASTRTTASNCTGSKSARRTKDVAIRGNKPPKYENYPTTSSSTSAMDLERQIVRAGRQGKTDVALDLFYAIAHPTLRQVNAAIDACARATPVRLTTAFAIVQALSMEEVEPQSTSFNNNTSTFPNRQKNKNSRRSLKPNVYTYGALMNAVSRQGDVHTAVQLLDTMEQQHKRSSNSGSSSSGFDGSSGVVRPNAVVYQSAVTAAANANPARPDIALALLHRAQAANVTLTVVGYNAAITAAARASDWRLAVQLLRTMQQEQTDEVGGSQNATTTTTMGLTSVPRPDAVTYGTVMAACEKCGEWRQVLQFSNDMQNAGLPLDGMAITSALHACQQFGLASTAIQYLNRMKRVGAAPQRLTAGRERIGSRQGLCGPDAVAYRLTISACARGGAWQEGLRVLDEYCETLDNRDVVAYTAAMHGCEYAGEWQEAIRLLGRMRASGVEPNEVTFVSVMGACAKACANLESNASTRSGVQVTKTSETKKQPMRLPLQKALQILNVMRKDSTVVDPNVQVYNAAIRACAEGLDVSRSFQLLQMLRDDGLSPNIVTYGTLMTACQRVGTLVGMNKVFQFMRHDDLEPNEIIYGAAISCCRKAGETERSFMLLKKMIRDGLDPNVATFNTVLMAQIEQKTPSEKELDRVSEVFGILHSPDTVSAFPNRQSYSIAIKALAEHKRPREAEAILRLMRQGNHEIVPDVDLFTAAISSYEQIGQPLNALRLMESMRADGYDFYEVKVLNSLFKRVVKLANAVGQTWNKENDLDETAFLTNINGPNSIWNETDISLG